MTLVFGNCRRWVSSVLLLCLVGFHSVQGRAVKIKTTDRSATTVESRGPRHEKIFGISTRVISRNDDVIADEEISLAGSEKEVCGRRPVHPPRSHRFGRPGITGRVVAGIESTNHWPWQVALVNKTSKEIFCGGTLIDRGHIVTAAHCFDRKVWTKDNVLVILGEHDRSRHEGTEQEFPVDCVHVHHRYVTGVPYKNDIAVVKLKTSGHHDVIINDYVMPACMPDKNEFKAGDTNCYVTGWGYTSFLDFLDGRKPNIINHARIPILSRKQCKRAYGSFITNRMICAGHLEGARRADTCKGDSGGPLVCQREDGAWALAGVTSWGDNTFCNPSPTGAVPGVYTKVDKYEKWIKKIVKTKKFQNRKAL